MRNYFHKIINFDAIPEIKVSEMTPSKDYIFYGHWMPNNGNISGKQNVQVFAEYVASLVEDMPSEKTSISIGDGEDVYKDEVSNVFRFKSILRSLDIDVASDTDDVIISYSPDYQTLDSSTHSIEWDINNGRYAEVILPGSEANYTLQNPTNKRPGTYFLKVIQGGAGSNTITYSSDYKFSTTTPSPTLSTGVAQVDILTFVSDGSRMYLVNFNKTYTL